MATYDDLKRAARDAYNRGDQAALQHFLARIDAGDYEEQQSGAHSLAQGISQGATLGFADELGAAARAGGGDWLIGGLLAGAGVGDYKPTEGPDTFFNRMRDYQKQFTAEAENISAGDAYNEALESQREALATARREDPYITFGGELAGGLATGGAGMARSAAGLGTREAIRQGARTGLGLGAVAGYGYGEGDVIAALLQESIPGGAGGMIDPETGEMRADWGRVGREGLEAGLNTALGGVLGAGVGALLPAAVGGVKKMAEFLSRRWTRDQRISEVGRREIMDLLEQDLAEQNMTIEQAQRMLDDVPGMSIADLGPRMQALTETVAQSGTAGGRRLEQALRLRQTGDPVTGTPGAYERIMPKINELLGGKFKNRSQFYDDIEKMTLQMKQEGDEAFGAAFRVPMEMTRDMHNILTRTTLGQRATRAAQQLVDMRPPRPGQTAPPAYGKPGTMASTERMQLILEAMNGEVDRMFRSPTVNNKVAGAARELADSFEAMVLAQSDDLARARQGWASDAANLNAMERGAAVFRDDAGEVALNMARASESEKTHFRLGVIKAIEDQLGQGKTMGDLAGRLIDSKKKQQIMYEVFGGEDAFNQFFRFLQQQQTLYQTFQRSTGNSATARRFAQITGNVGEKLAQLAGYGVSLSTGLGLPPSIGGFLAGRAYRGTGLPRAQQQFVEDVFSQQGQQLMGRNLSQLSTPPSGLLNPALPSAVPRVSGGLIAAGQPQGLLGARDRRGSRR